MEFVTKGGFEMAKTAKKKVVKKTVKKDSRKSRPSRPDAAQHEVHITASIAEPICTSISDSKFVAVEFDKSAMDVIRQIASAQRVLAESLRSVASVFSDHRVVIEGGLINVSDAQGLKVTGCQFDVGSAGFRSPVMTPAKDQKDRRVAEDWSWSVAKE